MTRERIERATLASFLTCMNQAADYGPLKSFFQVLIPFQVIINSRQNGIKEQKAAVKGCGGDAVYILDATDILLCIVQALPHLVHLGLAPIKRVVCCILGGKIFGNGGFQRETDGFWGTATPLRSSKAAKTKMQPTSSEGRKATGPWNAGVMFRDGNLDFDTYGYHMDII